MKDLRDVVKHHFAKEGGKIDGIRTLNFESLHVTPVMAQAVDTLNPYFKAARKSIEAFEYAQATVLCDESNRHDQ